MPDELDALDDTPRLATIDGVPDWTLAFLKELRDNPAHRGSINHAAEAVGRTWEGVSYWRDKSPAFAAELIRIRIDVLDATIDELEHLALTFAIDGFEEITDETFTPTPDAAGNRRSQKKKRTWEIKHIQWLLERLYRQRYGLDPTGIANAGKVTFVFKLGDNDNAETEADEITTIPPLALPPGQPD